MRKTKQKFYGIFEQPLIYVDGPQLVLLKGPVNTKIVAVAANNYEDFEYPFFAAEVSQEQFIEYLKERFDLRYLFLKPDTKRHYFFDLDAASEKKIPLVKVKFEASKFEQFIPDAGLFSRSHTEKLNIPTFARQSEEIYAVDGAWDLSEFSHFYNYITDLYALFDSVEVYSQPNTDTLNKQQIRAAFRKPFEGGGSYVSLYDSLSGTRSPAHRLRVGGITYNSPGHVKLKGFAKPFTEIRDLIKNFDQNRDKLKQEYTALRQILAQNKLLKMPLDKFRSSWPVTKVMESQTKKFTNALNINYSELKLMCDNNPLVTAKVILSIFRRAEKLHEFFLEGRVSLE